MTGNIINLKKLTGIKLQNPNLRRSASLLQSVKDNEEMHVNDQLYYK